MLPDGTYVMSIDQMSKAIELSKVYGLRFLASDALKTLQGKDYTGYTLPIEKDNHGKRGSSRIKVVPLDAVVAFWVSQSNKGNAKASALVSACAMEALERRCDRIFRVRKTEQEYEHESAINRLAYEKLWSQARLQHESVQGAFNNYCQGNGLNPKVIHNWISEEITGMTASQQKRRLSLVGDNPDLGVDHIQSPHDLQLMAEAKLAMLGLKLDIRKMIQQTVDKARARCIEFE
jgi:hypothetical protein